MSYAVKVMENGSTMDAGDYRESVNPCVFSTVTFLGMVAGDPTGDSATVVKEGDMYSVVLLRKDSVAFCQVIEGLDAALRIAHGWCVV